MIKIKYLSLVFFLIPMEIHLFMLDEKNNNIKVAFIHGRPAGHPIHVEYAKLLNADFFYEDRILKWLDGKSSKISEIDYFADGGKAGSSSNSGKGGHIVKVLTERNNGKVFQNNYSIEENSGYTFEVGVQFNYKLFYEL